MKAVILIVLALALTAGVYLRHQDDEKERVVSSGSTSLSDMRIEVADTEESRVQGLSGRTELPSDFGMLFVFEESGTYGIWMKDMYVSIDIVWIKDTGEIVGVEREVSPDTYPNVFYPSEPVRYVLEIPSGQALHRGFSTGKSIDI